MAVGYCLILLGVSGSEAWSAVWRMPDCRAGLLALLPDCLYCMSRARCTEGHDRPETLGLFLLLQLPAVLFESKSAPGELSPEGVKFPAKPARPVAPLSALEFTVFLLLIAGLWHVLHLLRGDVGGMAHSRRWRYALDAGSWLLCLPWFFIVRGRLKALGRMRWTMVFCATVFFSCLLLFYFRVISFPWAIVLFVVPQIPVIILRKETISGRVIPVDSDS